MQRLMITLMSIGIFVCSCKDKPTQPPEDGNAAKPSDQTTVEPVKEPDPPEIANARSQYLVGNYDQVVNTLQPLVTEYKQNKKHRAAGLAASWLALALAQDVVENAKETVEFALSMGEQTDDKEVKSAAKLAYGVYLLGVEDFANAAIAFSDSVNIDQSGPNVALALKLHGDAKIGLAFGGEETITNPAELDEAVASYGKARAVAERQTASNKQENDVMLARALEGLASAARYKGDKAESCTQVEQVLKLYETAGMARDVVEGALQLKQQANCQ